MMKDILEKHGYHGAVTGSPKSVIKTAYQASMIIDEEIWLLALQARNNVVHSYNKEVAFDIIEQTKQHFFDMFCHLKEEIDKNWL